MEDSTKETGRKDACMVMGFIHGLQVSLMKDSTTWTKRKDMEVTDGETEGDTSETGSKTKDMEKVA